MPDTDRQSGRILYPPRVEPPERAPALPIFLAEFVRNPLRTLPRQVYEEPCAPYRLGRPGGLVWITAPSLVERVLLHEHERFPKTPLERRIFDPILGEGILTAQGAAWRWQRKLAAPLFRHSELLGYVAAMAEAGEAQVRAWQASPRGSLSPVDEHMTDTTFAVITRTILAGCSDSDGEIIKTAGDAFLSPISWEIAAALVGAPVWLWHPGKGRMSRAATTLRAAVARVVAARRAEPPGHDDLLARLLAARDPETGAPMPDALLLDNLTTFLAAGHETTAKALTWTLYLLARAPWWQARVRAEVCAVCGDRTVRAGDIERLAVTARVLKEAMRLYPPAPVLSRMAGEDVDLGGLRVSAGTLIIIPVYAVHRHRALWSDPDLFDPDRFLPEHEQAYLRTQFMPFGFGPRTCIGMSFAMIEATALLATFVRAARFEWDGRHEPEPVSRVTLRPKGGMPLRVSAAA